MYDTKSEPSCKVSDYDVPTHVHQFKQLNHYDWGWGVDKGGIYVAL